MPKWRGQWPRHRRRAQRWCRQSSSDQGSGGLPGEASADRRSLCHSRDSSVRKSLETGHALLQPLLLGGANGGLHVRPHRRTGEAPRAGDPKDSPGEASAYPLRPPGPERRGPRRGANGGALHRGSPGATLLRERDASLPANSVPTPPRAPRSALDPLWLSGSLL